MWGTGTAGGLMPASLLAAVLGVWIAKLPAGRGGVPLGIVQQKVGVARHCTEQKWYSKGCRH
jgi:hypothetical protein